LSLGEWIYAAAAIGLLLAGLYYALPPMNRLWAVKEPAPGFYRGTFCNRNEESIPYAFYKPPAFSGDGPFPLIVFLHGEGERYANGQGLLGAGLGPSITAHVRKGTPFPFMALFPLDPEGQWHAGSKAVKNLFDLLDYVIQKHHVDPTRVYLTGHSSGGRAVWELAATAPSRWAAIAPVCGIFKPSRMTELRSVPCWVFHGDADPLIPVGVVKEMVSALKQVGGSVRYTELAQEKHGIWPKVYMNPDLYRWLAEQHK
jgi:predicted peptidase